MNAKLNIEVEDLENTLKNSDSYVHDMLKFYEEGWDARGIDDIERMKARVKANVINTLTYTNEIIRFFQELNLKPKSAHIKLDNPFSQSVLIAVTIDDFVNSDLLKVYKKTHSIEKSSRSDNYRVNFSITYDDGDMSEDMLEADGFVKTHDIAYN